MHTHRVIIKNEHIKWLYLHKCWQFHIMLRWLLCECARNCKQNWEHYITSKSFFGQRTRLSSENSALKNSLLRPKNTFSFGQGVFSKVGTHFSSQNAALQNSLLRPEKLFHLVRANFLRTVLWAYRSSSLTWIPRKSLLGPYNFLLNSNRIGTPYFSLPKTVIEFERTHFLLRLKSIGQFCLYA